MDKRKLVSILVVGTLVLAAATAFAVHTVNAQAPTPTPSTGSPAAPGGQSTVGKPGLFRGMKGMQGGYNQDDLAAALGITVEKLQAAQSAAQAEALKQAVSQGLITQEQADQIAQNGGGRWFHFGERGKLGSTIDMNALLANALGISVEDLQAAQVKAFNAAVDRAVTEGTLTQDQADLMKGQHALAANQKFQTNMQSAYEAAVAQAVKDGVITQAQADLILQNSQQRGFPGWGGGFDGPHGFGGRGGRQGWKGGPVPQAPTTPQTPVVPSTDGA